MFEIIFILDRYITYLECPENLLSHLDVLIRDVYLPLLSCPWPSGDKGSPLISGKRNPEQLNELLHRMLSTVDVAFGQMQGALVLPLPNLDLLLGLVHPDAVAEPPELAAAGAPNPVKPCMF